ncbi:MAG: hypothetical protein ACK6D7_20025 [Acidobacteriota bacterium]
MKRLRSPWWVFRQMVSPPMATARAISTTQTLSQPAGLVCRAASQAAPRAVTPIQKPPQPGTAVNSPDRSMVRRI